MRVHQSNRLKILAHEAASARLDASIRDAITLLASTRREVVSATATKFPEDQPRHPYTYSELLGFAQRISKTSLPPPGVLSSFPTANPAGVDASNTPDTGPTAPNSAGIPGATPLPSATDANGSGATPAPTPGDAHPAASSTAAAPPIQGAETSLPTALHAHLNPHLSAAFVPWPEEDKLRSGALSALQSLVDRGVDPAGYDPEAADRQRAAEEAARRAEREEAERQAREDWERRRAAAAAAAEAEQHRRASAQPGLLITDDGGVIRRDSIGMPLTSPTSATGRGANSGQFQFMTGDEEDSDDDD